MSKIEVNQISSQCGSTLTVGQSGDTVTLASGASQTGFGREGSVDWQTDIKTATFTAANGEGYFCNTSGGTFTINLPSASVGSIVSIKDYSGSFATNSLTVSPNGTDKINGTNADAILDTNNLSVTLVYADSTKGWLNVNESTSVDANVFISATGGTITTCGNFKIHTFTGPGTFCVSAGSGQLSVADYLVVAGGGGGGRGNSHGSGAGAGGFRESSGTASGCYTASPLGACVSAIPITVQGYPITVGGGGAGANVGPRSYGTKGSDSSALSITSTGGGQGGGWDTQPGLPGGSGSGSANRTPGDAVGSGNTPPVSPPQGNPGGPADGPRMGGGGGAGEAGNTDGIGIGGDGAETAINASATFYAGGGGAGGSSCSNANAPGGDGGGGIGSGSGAGGAGTANTGGGGGGSFSSQDGGAGGSGVVIIRYKFQ